MLNLPLLEVNPCIVIAGYPKQVHILPEGFQQQYLLHFNRGILLKLSQNFSELQHISIALVYLTN